MTSSRAAKIRRRTWIGSAQVAVLAFLIWLATAGEWRVVLSAGTLIAIAATWEVHRLGRLSGRGLAWILLPAHVLVNVAVHRDLLGEPSRTLLVQLGLVLGVVLVWRPLYLGLVRPEVERPLGGVRDHARDAGLALWLVPALPWLAYVWSDFGLKGVIGLVLLSKIGDTAGYYVGSAIGKRHPFPRISPGKTVAGCVASLVAGIAAGVVAVQTGLLPEARLGLLGAALAGAVINLAAQTGDLLESFVKRRAGVKDSGTLFGPSGGFLDLVDSLLLTVPAALLVWPWLFADAN